MPASVRSFLSTLLNTNSHQHTTPQTLLFFIRIWVGVKRKKRTEQQQQQQQLLHYSDRPDEREREGGRERDYLMMEPCQSELYVFHFHLSAAQRNR